MTTYDWQTSKGSRKSEIHPNSSHAGLTIFRLVRIVSFKIMAGLHQLWKEVALPARYARESIWPAGSQPAQLSRNVYHIWKISTQFTVCVCVCVKGFHIAKVPTDMRGWRKWCLVFGHGCDTTDSEISPQPRRSRNCGDIWESVVSQPWSKTRYQFLFPNGTTNKF